MAIPKLGTGVRVGVSVGIGVGVNVGAGVSVGIGVNVEVGVRVAVGVEVAVGVGVGLEPRLERTAQPITTGKNKLNSRMPALRDLWFRDILTSFLIETFLRGGRTRCVP